MDMTGEYRIPAPRQTVWEALNDPEVLRQCIPGCEEIDKLSATEMTAKVTAKVGPVKARFSGKVTLSDLDPPNGYRISGEGTGGAAGFAKGGAAVKLADDGEGTRLNYTVEAHVGGKLAQIGSRLVDAAAKKVADDFFRNFKQKVGGGGGGGRDDDATVVLPSSGEDTTVVLAPPPKEKEHDEHGKPIPRDPQLPDVSNRTLMFFSAGALVVFIVALVLLLR